MNAVNKGAGRLAWLAAPDVANRLAISNTRGGTSPTGVSEAYGLPLFVSSGMLAGTLALINGDQVAGDVQGFGLEATDQATLNMDTAPTLPNAVTGAGAPSMVSLWQENSIALGMTAMGDMAGCCRRRRIADRHCMERTMTMDDEQIGRATGGNREGSIGTEAGAAQHQAQLVEL